MNNTGDFLAATLQPGNASSTAADHITVLDQALAQIPDEHRHGCPVLVRADTASAAKAFLTHVRSLRNTGVDVEFSVDRRTDRLHAVIATMPKAAWIPAIDLEGQPVERSHVAELTPPAPDRNAHRLPEGHKSHRAPRTPAPGAQLNLFEEANGWRYAASATTGAAQLAHLDARHRAHTRVEDCIRTSPTPRSPHTTRPSPTGSKHWPLNPTRLATPAPTSPIPTPLRRCTHFA
jgi:hypothetical protein